MGKCFCRVWKKETWIHSISCQRYYSWLHPFSASSNYTSHAGADRVWLEDTLSVCRHWTWTDLHVWACRFFSLSSFEASWLLVHSIRQPAKSIMRFSQILIVIKYIYEFTDVIQTLSSPLVHEKFKSLCCVILLSHENLSLYKLQAKTTILHMDFYRAFLCSSRSHPSSDHEQDWLR